MSDDGHPELLQEVQSLTGRCMLRLQQYEHLLKAVLAYHELAGPVETLEAQREVGVAKLASKALGALVEALFDTCVVADGYERDLLPEGKTPSDRISMAFSLRLSMEPQRLAEVRAAVEELVVMRNDLVHHFIQRFDLRSGVGCAAAKCHLEAAICELTTIIASWRSGRRAWNRLAPTWRSSLRARPSTTCWSTVSRRTGASTGRPVVAWCRERMRGRA